MAKSLKILESNAVKILATVQGRVAVGWERWGKGVFANTNRESVRVNGDMFLDDNVVWKPYWVSSNTMSSRSMSPQVTAAIFSFFTFISLHSSKSPFQSTSPAPSVQVPQSCKFSWVLSVSLSRVCIPCVANEITSAIHSSLALMNCRKGCL